MNDDCGGAVAFLGIPVRFCPVDQSERNRRRGPDFVTSAIVTNRKS
jgi:hypothetical protein